MVSTTMTAPRPIHHTGGEALRRMALRWSLAGLGIVTLHGGLVYAALNWPQAVLAVAEPPAAIMIELAPVPVAPDMPPRDIALGPQMEQAQAATPSEQEDKPVEDQNPEPELKPEMKTAIAIPPLPEKREAVLAEPAAPEPHRDTPKQEQHKPDRPKKAQKKPQVRKAQNAPATSAPQAANVQRASSNGCADGGDFVLCRSGNLA